MGEKTATNEDKVEVFTALWEHKQILSSDLTGQFFKRVWRKVARVVHENPSDSVIGHTHCHLYASTTVLLLY